MPARIRTIALIIALTSTHAWAQDYLVNVNGIVCEFCSLGVVKKVSKLPFIDTDRYDHGVSVDIENQMVTVAVRADADLDKQALFAAIESAGYNPVEIFELTADGSQIAYQP